MGGPEVVGAVCLKDESLIDSLVVQPMRNAKRNPRATKYAATGRLTLALPDGSNETMILYVPWGHYIRGKEHFTADFSGLEAACTTALGEAQRLMDSAREIERPERPKGKEKGKSE